MSHLAQGQRRRLPNLLYVLLLISATKIIYPVVAANTCNDRNIHATKSRIPIIFANRDNLHSKRRNNSSNIKRILNTSSRRNYYATNIDYDDGGYTNDEIMDEWDRLEQIKKEIQSKLGGYRPWSIDTRSRRPGAYSITTKLVIANVAFYALQTIMPRVTRLGAKRSELILQGKELHRLITPIFLHGSITHLMLNTFSLQNIGPEVERLFGGGRFLSTYLAAGIAGKSYNIFDIF